MSIDEGRRLLLYDAAREAWGSGAALVLMEMLPPTEWMVTTMVAMTGVFAAITRLG